MAGECGVEGGGRKGQMTDEEITRAVLAAMDEADDIDDFSDTVDGYALKVTLNTLRAQLAAENATAARLAGENKKLRYGLVIAWQHINFDCPYCGYSSRDEGMHSDCGLADIVRAALAGRRLVAGRESEMSEILLDGRWPITDAAEKQAYELGYRAGLDAAARVCKLLADSHMAHADKQGHSQLFIEMGKKLDDPQAVFNTNDDLTPAETASLIAFNCAERIRALAAALEPGESPPHPPE